MRPRSAVLILAGLCLLVATAPAWAQQRRANMPEGWTWPPSPEMRQLGRKCLSELSELGVKWKRAPRKRMIATPVVIPEMQLGGLELVPIWRKPPFVMDCHLALALARHGEALVEIGVRQLRFSSIHDFRRVRKNQRTHRALSRHALGLAIDVYELVLDDGTTLVVQEDFHSEHHHTILHIDARLRGSGGFRAVLSPIVDPRSHYDHFHIEARAGLPERPRRARAKQSKARQAQKAKARQAQKARQARKARQAKKARQARKQRAARQADRKPPPLDAAGD